MKKVPKHFKVFFWDVDIYSLDLKKNKFFIIERLLNEGDHHSLHWLFQNYTVNEIKEVVKKSRELSAEVAHCWRSYFNLKEEEMRCFGKS